MDNLLIESRENIRQLKYWMIKVLLWRIDCNVVGFPQGPVFYAKNYRVIDDSQGKVGGVSHRVRLLKRVDQTNVRELYLGQTSRFSDGALLTADRIVDSAVPRVWPLLDDTGDRQLPPLA